MRRQVGEILDAMRSVSLMDVVRSAINVLPWVCVGIGLNYIGHRIHIYFTHRDLRKKGRGYLIDRGKDPKRPKHESNESEGCICRDREKG